MEEQFNANQARELVKQLQKNEIVDIINKIKKEAEHGYCELHIHRSLEHETIKELRKRKFKVVNHPAIAIQREDLYYSIYW